MAIKASTHATLRLIMVLLVQVLLLVAVGTVGADPGPNTDKHEQCQVGANDISTFDCTTSGPDGWTTGNNEGVILEGDTVPYRLLFINMVPGNQYRIQIEWDTTKSGNHALDYLKTFNATVLSANACASLTGVTCGAASTFPIPADSIMQSDPGWAGSQDAGDFTIYNGTITAVSGYTLDRSSGSDVTEPPGAACTAGGCYNGDTSTFIDIFFTANSADVVLAWGGHTASYLDWGVGNSAAVIDGSPYHMRLNEFYDVTNDENLGTGQKDIGLKATGVIIPGTITIVKDTQPDDQQNFTFNVTDDGGSPVNEADGTPVNDFDLDDDADVTLLNSRTLELLPGTYVITELASTNWNLASITCLPTSGSTTIPDGLNEGSVEIVLEEAANETCTFVNIMDTTAIDLFTLDSSNRVSGALMALSLAALLLVTSTLLLLRRRQKI